MRQRICPECGADLDMKRESAKAHALSHWEETIPDDPRYVEAKRRQKILYDMHVADLKAAALKEA